MVGTFLIAVLSGFLSRELAAILPSVEDHLPGFMKGFIDGFINSDTVKAKVAEAEANAEKFLNELSNKGLTELEQWLVGHVKGNLGAALAAALAAHNPPVKLNAAEVRKLQTIQAAGKLDATLDAGVASLGTKIA